MAYAKTIDGINITIKSGKDLEGFFFDPKDPLFSSLTKKLPVRPGKAIIASRNALNLNDICDNLTSAIEQRQTMTHKKSNGPQKSWSGHKKMTLAVINANIKTSSDLLIQAVRPLLNAVGLKDRSMSYKMSDDAFLVRVPKDKTRKSITFERQNLWQFIGYLNGLIWALKFEHSSDKEWAKISPLLGEEGKESKFVISSAGFTPYLCHSAAACPKAQISAHTPKSAFIKTIALTWEELSEVNTPDMGYLTGMHAAVSRCKESMGWLPSSKIWTGIFTTPAALKLCKKEIKLENMLNLAYNIHNITVGSPNKDAIGSVYAKHRAAMMRILRISQGCSMEIDPKDYIIRADGLSSKIVQDHQNARSAATQNIYLKDSRAPWNAHSKVLRCAMLCLCAGMPLDWIYNINIAVVDIEKQAELKALMG